MKQNKPEKNFVVCIKSDDHQASLEIRKIYQVLSDSEAQKQNLIRVIDESGEDYLFPTEYFIPIELSQEIAQAFDKAA